MIIVSQHSTLSKLYLPASKVFLSVFDVWGILLFLPANKKVTTHSHSFIPITYQNSLPMKLVLTFACLLCIISTSSAQIHTVDNFNPGADYTSLQTAIDSANDGDTIYVAGSSVPYGDLTIDKELTIFGNGYEVAEETKASIIGNVVLESGCSKSHISGFRANYFDFATLSGGVDSVTISDNRCLYIRFVGGKNHIIEGNLLTRTADWNVGLAYSFSSDTLASNVVIRNNVFYGSLVYSRSSTNLLENNTFVKGTTHPNNNPFYGSTNYNTNVIVVNNIFFGSSMSNTYGCNSCTFSFNSFYHYDGTGYVGDNPLFINPDTLATSNASGFSEDHDINLQPGSPAIGAGQGGFDLGATGGATPFIYGGYAPLPRVVSISTSTPFIEEGETIQVTIEAVSKQ